MQPTIHETIHCLFWIFISMLILIIGLFGYIMVLECKNERLHEELEKLREFKRLFTVGKNR